MRQHAEDLTQDAYTVQTRVVGDYRYSAVSVTYAINPSQHMRPRDAPQGRVLSILIADATAYMGISWAAQNLSPFRGGVPYFREPVPNRAGLKLLEALEAFDIRAYPGAYVLDLGAAPGAWTEVMRRRELNITAVAPKPMYDWLQVDPQVHYLPMLAEEYLDQCHTTFDYLLNDMIVDPQYSARLMVDYARHLKPSGVAIMTLKLRMTNPRRVMDHSFRILRKAYRIIRVRQLVHNRKEVTLFMRRDV